MPNPEPPPSIENPVWALERLKDRIVAFFSARDLDDSTKTIWCDDAKGMYYRVVNVDVMLSHGLDAERCRGMLDGATSRFGQVSSELRALGDQGLQLERELKAIFEVCHAALSARIPPIQPLSVETFPARVVKKPEEEYDLPCSICGRNAVVVHPTGSEETILQGIICAGITRGVGLKVKDKERIFGWLEKGDLAALHKYMDAESDIDGGLDGYCPECDRIYCRVHYNVKEEWDEGFYDCSRGVCPLGHSRIVDD